MITNNQIKYIKSLNQKKFRQKYNKFIVEGDKICRDLLSQDIYEIDVIYARKHWLKDQGEILGNSDVLAIEVSEKELQKISNFKTANQALCIISQADSNINLTKDHNNIIYLDGIQDPGNMGTIIRIAEWFGFESIVSSPESVDFYNPKVIQSTMGSFIRVELSVDTLSNLKMIHKEKPILGATLNGSNIYEVDLKQPQIIVIGNESNGISKENLSLLTKEITIPAYSDRLDSLNAAVATAIICAEIRR